MIFELQISLARPTHQLTIYLQLYSGRSITPQTWDYCLALVHPSITHLHIMQDHSFPTVLKCGPRSYLLSCGVQAVPVNVSALDCWVARDVDLQSYGVTLGDLHLAVYSNHCRVP